MHGMWPMPGLARGALIQRQSAAEMRVFQTPDPVFLGEAAAQNIIEPGEHIGEIGALGPAQRQAAHIGPIDAELIEQFDIEFDQLGDFIEAERVMLIRIGFIIKFYPRALQRAGEGGSAAGGNSRR